MPLDPDLQDQVDEGRIARLDLIRFDLPGKTVGYHRGGRPFTWNGLVYLPNRWLSPGGMNQALGVAVTTRTVTFANVPVADTEDAIARLEDFDYPNAPVVITHLGGDPETDEVLGVLASSIYEIDKVRYREGAADANGLRSLTIDIDLQPPGRSARGSTGVKRSTAEHQFDNDATDTFFEHVATNITIPEEWGQAGQTGSAAGRSAGSRDG